MQGHGSKMAPFLNNMLLEKNKVVYQMSGKREGRAVQRKQGLIHFPVKPHSH